MAPQILGLIPAVSRQVRRGDARESDAVDEDVVELLEWQPPDSTAPEGGPDLAPALQWVIPRRARGYRTEGGGAGDSGARPAGAHGWSRDSV